MAEPSPEYRCNEPYKFEGYNPDGPFHPIPNYFLDWVMSTLGMVELKIALLFLISAEPLTTRKIMSSGISRASALSCLNRWESKGIIKHLDLSPRINFVAPSNICAGCDIHYPFLDEHHIKYRKNGGDDTNGNKVNLCPNCHRLMHLQVWILTNKGRQWLGLPNTNGDNSNEYTNEYLKR